MSPLKTHLKTILFSVASDPLRGLNGAPIIEPFDSYTTIEVNTDKTIECKAQWPVTWISEVRQLKSSRDKKSTMFSSFQILNSQDGNVNIINFVADDSTADERNIYRSHLEFQSITTEYVGKYYCVFNNSIKNESEKNFDEEVEKFKASSIYIFVDGKRRIDVNCRGSN